MSNFLDPSILFFVFGVLAGILKSNLEIPQPISILYGANLKKSSKENSKNLQKSEKQKQKAEKARKWRRKKRMMTSMKKRKPAGDSREMIS